MISSDQVLDMPEISPHLDEANRIFAGLNSELAGLNLIAFAAGCESLTQAAVQLEQWQNGTQEERVMVPYAAQRKNADRLRTLGFLARSDIALPGKQGLPHMLTDLGYTGLAFAGHLLTLVDKCDVPLYAVFGQKIRRLDIPKNDEAPRSEIMFTQPLFRSVVAIAVLRSRGGEIEREELSQVSPVKLAKLNSEIKKFQADDLATKGILEAKKRFVPAESGFGAHKIFFSIPDNHLELVAGLESLVFSLLSNDTEQRSEFLRDGISQAEQVKQDPNRVARLLDNWHQGAQESYEVSREELLTIVEELRREGPFTTGMLRRRLGGVHGVYYLSNVMSRLTEEGAVSVVGNIGSGNRRLFQ